MTFLSRPSRSSQQPILYRSSAVSNTPRVPRSLDIFQPDMWPSSPWLGSWSGLDPLRTRSVKCVGLEPVVRCESTRVSQQSHGKELTPRVKVQHLVRPHAYGKKRNAHLCREGVHLTLLLAQVPRTNLGASQLRPLHAETTAMSVQIIQHGRRPSSRDAPRELQEHHVEGESVDFSTGRRSRPLPHRPGVGNLCNDVDPP